MKSLVIVIGVLLCVAVLLPQGDADCCRAGMKKIGGGVGPTGVSMSGEFLCQDCTYPTPCCGTGKCNIFCCKCHGHCREGCKVSRALGWVPLYSEDEPGTGSDVVQEGDLDGDGRLSFAEAKHYVSKRSIYDPDTAHRMLVDMDKDSDNFFSPEEIDY